MRVACPSCRAQFEIDAELSEGPGLPLCDACSSAGIAPPPPPTEPPRAKDAAAPPIRKARPKVPAVSFGRRRLQEDEERAEAAAAEAEERAWDELALGPAAPAPVEVAPVLDGGFTRTGRPISVLPPAADQPATDELASGADPVSLQDLGKVLGPAAAPPTSSMLAPVRVPRPPLPSRPPIEERRDEDGGPTSGLIDIRRLAAAAEAREDERAKPAPRKPMASKPSFFRVDSIAPPTEPDEIPVTTEEDDVPPSSGHADLQSLLDPPSEHPARVAEVLIHLDGGLFGHASPRPAVDLPPPTSAPIAPVLSIDRVAPSSRPPPRVIAPVAQIAEPGVRTKSSAPGPVVSERAPAPRRRGALAWVAGMVVGSAITAFVASRLTAPSAPAEVVVTATARPAPPPPAPIEPTTRPASDHTDVRPKVSADAPEPARTVEPSRSAQPSATPRAAEPARPAPPASPASTVAGTARPAPPPAVPATPAPAPAPAPAGGDFDKAAARTALAAAASAAASCKQPDDPSGGARVSVTFAPSGRVTSAKLAGGVFGGTPTGGCIVRAFRSISVPAFAGDPVTVTKDVSVQ